MVDARREAVGVEECPFLRDFSKSLEERWSQKRGGAKGGAPSYIRRTATSLALLLGLVCAALPVVHALSSCGSALLLWVSVSCGSAGPVVHALLVLWSDLFVGDVDWRRSSAGCVARPSGSVRGAPERAHQPSRHLEGAGNLPWSRGTRSVLQVPRYKGPRTLSTSLSVRGSFLYF